MKEKREELKNVIESRRMLLLVGNRYRIAMVFAPLFEWWLLDVRLMITHPENEMLGYVWN